jgi:hypothetical protein
MQNTSYAVMAQRAGNKKSLDDFPTPLWATRALVEKVIGAETVRGLTCLEPACGRGHMAVALAEYFSAVEAKDVFGYGFGAVADFLKANRPEGSVDWVITNPPFRLAEDFIVRALPIARVGVAMLVRTVFIEGVRRYKGLFQPTPPTYVAQFAERVPMVKARIDKNASTATAYAWLVWIKNLQGKTESVWIPPVRKILQRDGDYVQAPKMPKAPLY